MNLIKIISPCVLGFMTSEGQQIWTKHRTTRRSEATKRCVECRGPIVGEAFRPLTNKNNRGHRLCTSCADRMILSFDPEVKR